MKYCKDAFVGSFTSKACIAIRTASALPSEPVGQVCQSTTGEVYSEPSPVFNGVLYVCARGLGI